MKSIDEIVCYCKKCDLRFYIVDTETDVDGDGSLGCPICFAVVKVECDHE